MAGPCRPGDVLGLVEGDVVVIGSDLPATAADVLDRMLGGGGELVTLVRRRRRAGRLAAGGRRRPAPCADQARGRRARSTTAASRTTRCWSGSSDVLEPCDSCTLTDDLVGSAKTAKPLDGRRSTCAPSATCCGTTRAATPSAAS